VLGFSAYVWLLKHAPISRVATYAYVNPVVALTLGWLTFSEPISATSLIGAQPGATAAVVLAGEPSLDSPDR